MGGIKMREYDKERKKIVEKLNLPKTCMYCKGLGFNCQETIWKSLACEKYLKYNTNPIVEFIDTTERR